MIDDDKQRRFGRIELEEPMLGHLGELPVSVVEISMGGFRVAHDSRFQPGEARELRFLWKEQPLRYSCSVVRSTLFRIAAAAGQKSIYHSGVRVDEAYDESDRILRELIAQRIMRALEEQKANAHGLEPVAAWTYDAAKTDRYRRYELQEGVWRKLDTRDPKQPQNGFTIAANIDPLHVDLLCETYETSNEEGRRLTRMLAELSVSRREGPIMLRRYFP